jgi:hypothetical protein
MNARYSSPLHPLLNPFDITFPACYGGLPDAGRIEKFPTQADQETLERGMDHGGDRTLLHAGA